MAEQGRNNRGSAGARWRDTEVPISREEKAGLDPAVEDAIAESETGARAPSGVPAQILIHATLAWSLFQLWLVSPLPFILNLGIFNSTEARSIHLAFAIFLAYTAYPALKSSPRDRIPWHDWLFGLTAALCAGYLSLFQHELATRAGLPSTLDIAVGVTGVLLLLEATRRTLGPPLMVVAALFLAYTFLGPYMPEILAHKGASLSKAASHYWITTEGVFGIALGVSTSMVFLFVLFGSLLERAGAGAYFIRVAFSVLGHFRGGPAKAAVLSSGMTGLISGSSIANVVTTGTFTIPLMKRVGLPAEKAGAVEVASSTNGQLTPPVMGAAAFLMVEYVGISYVELIKHAIVPALIAYIALFYIVHLEAMKLGLKGMEREIPWPLRSALVGVFGTFFGLVILSFLLYHGLGWVKGVFGEATPWITTLLAFTAYVGLLARAVRFPEPAPLDRVSRLPPPGPTIQSGLHFLLPVVVLIWNLMVERLSPGLSAFWATLFMMFIIVTQRPLRVLMGRGGEIRSAFRAGLTDLKAGLVSGARNMIAIGVATAAAGIVVGTVTLTGVGLVMTELVEFISGGNVMLMLLLTAVISLILGMGLPTTANYIVVSTLMAPVIVTLGAEAGLIVPLIAVHLFVFYFGILADDTPPVGLAAFAASAIARSDPIRTGIQGFAYDIRTAVLPFLFIFNTELLLIGVDTLWHGAAVFLVGLTAMLTFAAATQRFLLVQTRWWEVAALLLVAFTLFRPDFWWDRLHPPFDELPGNRIVEVAESQPAGARLRMAVTGLTIEGNEVTKWIALPLGESNGGEERLRTAGIELREEAGRMFIDHLAFASPAEKLGLDFDFEVLAVQQARERPPQALMFIPAYLLLGILLWNQQRRRRPAQ